MNDRIRELVNDFERDVYDQLHDKIDCFVMARLKAGIVDLLDEGIKEWSIRI